QFFDERQTVEPTGKENGRIAFRIVNRFAAERTGRVGVAELQQGVAEKSVRDRGGVSLLRMFAQDVDCAPQRILRGHLVAGEDLHFAEVRKSARVQPARRTADVQRQVD